MTLAFTISVEELEALVRKAVREELAGVDHSDDDKIMTREEVAKMLRVDERSVTNWVARRGLPGRKVGTHWRFSRREVLRWKEGQR